MRVASNNMGSLVADLNRINVRQADVSEQMSTGSRITWLGVDPAAAGQSSQLASGIRTADSFVQTAASVTARMQTMDSALGSVVSAVSSAVSLAVQGSTGTLNASNMQTLAQQLTGLRDQVLSLANSSYQGNYLFAGTAGAAQPFAKASDGTVTYAGNTDSATLSTDDGSTISIGVHGGQVFGSGGSNDVFRALNDAIGMLSSGNQVSASALNALRSSLDGVMAARSTLDTNMNRLAGASEYATAQKTQLTLAQTSLISADTAKLATELSSGETQRSALMSTIAVMQKGSLFDYL